MFTKAQMNRVINNVPARNFRGVLTNEEVEELQRTSKNISGREGWSLMSLAAKLWREKKQR